MDGKMIDQRDPLFPQAIVRLKSHKKDMDDSRKEHVCDFKVCNPQSEASLIHDGSLTGPPLTSNVFLCRFGVVHVCTKDGCSFHAASHTQTCPISGLNWGGSLVSDYDKNDYRTWKSKASVTVVSLEPDIVLKKTKTNEKRERSPQPPAAPPTPVVLKKKIHHKVLSDDAVWQGASNMVKLLLYSNNRISRNKEAIDVYQQQARDSMATYTKERADEHQLPYWTDLYRLKSHWSSQPLPLKEFVFNENLHDYYVNIICQVWKKVLKYYVKPGEKEYEEDGVTEIPPKVDLDTICLGVMYAMRQGIKHGDVILLPKDDFLLINLPIVTELPHFDIRRRCITDGDKILTETYENAIASDAPIQDLIIDVNYLPAKRAEVILKEENAKVTSSGEKLFMPQSRKKKMKK